MNVATLILALLARLVLPLPSDGIEVHLSVGGFPLEGIEVFWEGTDSEGLLGKSNAEGWLGSGPLSPQRGHLTAVWGEQRLEKEVVLLAGKVTSVEFVFDSESLLEVVVRGSGDLLPQAYLRLALADAQFLEGTTSTNGVVQFITPPGEYVLTIHHPDYEEQRVEITLGFGTKIIEVWMSSLPLSSSLASRLQTLQGRGLEVIILFDATRSMDDLLEGTRAAILDIAAVLESLVPGTKMGIGAYRAPQSAYTVHPKSRDLRLLDKAGATDILRFLRSVRADEGGNESVLKALEWSLDSRRGWGEDTMKVVILMGDAKQKEKSVRQIVQTFIQYAELLGGVSFHAMGANSLASGEDIGEESEGQFRALATALEGTYLPLPLDPSRTEGTLLLLRSLVGFAIGPEHQEELNRLLTAESLERIRRDRGW
ncbi:hypothetical protein H8D30_01795 [bacterium]|nr:hypothetical protein [bacterium]